MTTLDPASKNVKLAQPANVDLDRSQPWNLLPPRQLLRQNHVRVENVLLAEVQERPAKARRQNVRRPLPMKNGDPVALSGRLQMSSLKRACDTSVRMNSISATIRLRTSARLLVVGRDIVIHPIGQSVMRVRRIKLLLGRMPRVIAAAIPVSEAVEVDSDEAVLIRILRTDRWIEKAPPIGATTPIADIRMRRPIREIVKDSVQPMASTTIVTSVTIGIL